MFIPAVKNLIDTHKRFNAHQIKPVEHGNLREQYLAEALEALAATMGVTLEKPLHIDSRGEFSIVVARDDGKSTKHYEAGKYGVEFADLLNRYNPRCGVAPGATLLPENGWCRMNHFEVEKMVMDYYAATL